MENTDSRIKLPTSQQSARCTFVLQTDLALPPKSAAVLEKNLQSRIFKLIKMATEADKLTRVMLTRFKQSEYDLLNNRFKKTRFRKLSEYVRSVLLNKPITVFYRDKAIDDLLEEMVLLRQELNAVGNNLNQAMRSINSAHGNADARLWMNLLSVINSKLEPSINQIKERMNQYADIWSQNLKAEKA